MVTCVLHPVMTRSCSTNSQIRQSQRGSVHFRLKIQLLDRQRRLVLGGMLGAASLLAARPLRTFAASPDRTIVSADGIIRTTLKSYMNDAGEEFRLVLTTYPPGVGLPVHHHPSVAHNYILEGIAESQYAGEELFHFTSGQSYQDKASVKHMVFRNPAPAQISDRLYSEEGRVLSHYSVGGNEDMRGSAFLF